MGFENFSKTNESGAENSAEQLPEFESVINKQGIDRRGEEFAEQMTEHVREEIKAWMESAGELIPMAMSGGADRNKVDAILDGMGKGVDKFFEGINPVSREAAEYFKENVDDVVIQKWDELFKVAMAQEHETAEDVRAAASRIDEWQKGMAEKQEAYAKEWFDNFSKKLNETVGKFVAEIVQTMKSQKTAG